MDAVSLLPVCGITIGFLAYIHAIDRILTTAESLSSFLLWLLWLLAAACNFSYALVTVDSLIIKLDYSMHLTMCSACMLLNVWQSNHQSRRRVEVQDLHDVHRSYDNSHDLVMSSSTILPTIT